MQLGPRKRAVLMVALAVAAAGVVFSLRPIAQDSAYHNFADGRTLLGVPNALNVLSNVVYAVVGVLGLLFLLDGEKSKASFTEPRERRAFVALFAGVGLTAFGSGYYHLAPGNARLFWDRLPMTVGFMSLFSVIIAERIGMTAGRRLLAPLLAVGAASVAYWRQTELEGAGDLRLYVLVQFFPLLAIPVLLLLFPARYTRTGDLYRVIGWYVLAKILEALDAPIFALGGFTSGHTLKHLASGVAAYWILRMLKARRPLAAE